MNFLIDMGRCRSEMAEIMRKLPTDLNIPKCEGHAVQIPLGKNIEGKVFTVSLAVPPDTMGNRSCDNVDFPTAAETLLFCDGEPTYVSEWNYDDVLRWYSDRASDDENIAKILEEISRLKGLVSG
jgi:hypothetical protein